MVAATGEQTGISLGRAALVAGAGLAIMVVAAPFAEIFVYTRLVVADDPLATIDNIAANRGLYVAGTLAYLIVFVCDVLVAWALYWFFVPVDRPVSLLAAWFRIVYTCVAIVAAMKFIVAYRLVTATGYTAGLGIDELALEVWMLLQGFRYEWNLSLVVFGIHLLLLAYLAWRASYVPNLISALLGIAGLGYVVAKTAPYLAPELPVSWFVATALGEIVFMLWLLVRGRRLSQVAG